jgi:hypothetical protein
MVVANVAKLESTDPQLGIAVVMRILEEPRKARYLPQGLIWVFLESKAAVDYDHEAAHVEYLYHDR